jgi:putative ABC transport system permease protein
MDAELGFDVHDVVTVRIGLPAATYRETADVSRFARRLVEELDALPSIESAGAATSLPIQNNASGTAFEIEGQPLDPTKLPPMVQYDTVTPGFFQTLRVPVRQGRLFEWSDLREGLRPVIVNEAAAKQFWPGQEPIGKRIRRSTSSATDAPPWFTVLGVVGNVRQAGPRQPPPSLFYFLPAGADGDTPRVFSYVVRGPSAAAQTDAIRQTVRTIDRDLPVASIQTMQAVIDRSVVQFSFTMLTLGIAAVVALVLGAVGLYSVLSYAVSLRTREIGVRLALGAPRSRVMRAIVLRGAATSAIGLAVGAAGAAGLTRLLGSLLYETTPLDPLTFVAMAALLAIVALLASYLPARRAAATSPLEAMRSS